jgi:hypothetical protein
MDVLSSIVDLWTAQVKRAQKVKYECFGKTAAKAWRFLGKSYKECYEDEEDYRQLKHPDHRTRRNLTAEYLRLMLPYIHHKVPNRLVVPSRPAIPEPLMGYYMALSGMQPNMMQPGMMPPYAITRQQDEARAWLMTWFLNWTPTQFDLRGEGRKAATEALVKGRGVVWHEMFYTAYGPTPGSFYDSVDGLLVDPDCEHTLRDAAWIARRRRRSVWQVAEEFGIPAEQLRGMYKSHLQRSAEDASGWEEFQHDEETQPDAPMGTRGSGDVMEYWEVYTRGVGLGQKYPQASEELRTLGSATETLGDNLYLAIAPGARWPLNLHPGIMAVPDASSAITDSLRWPVPFFENRENPWPMTPLDFYPGTDCPWPSAPLEPAIPLQVFLDLGYGWLMGSMGTRMRQLICTSDSLEAAFREAIATGSDLEIVGMKGQVGQAIKDLFAVVELPAVKTDLYNVLTMVEHAFRMCMGTDSLLYGGGGDTQIRSSAEVQIRQGNLMNRPEDMAECAERWQSDIARAEGFMTRCMVSPQSVAPLFGEDRMGMDAMGQPAMGPLTQMWAMLINAMPDRAAMELAYTIEAGSGRRKNKQKQQADAQMLSQVLFQPLLGFAQATGMVQPVNALIDFLGEAFEADFTRMRFPAMPPQPAPGPTGPAPARSQAATNSGM